MSMACYHGRITASSTNPRVVWHASRADIERPTLEGRTLGDNHANSGLGIFCGAEPHSYLAGFGETVFALTLAPDARALQMSISELARMGRSAHGGVLERAWFESEGRRLAQGYDLIELVEIHGKVEQVILPRDEAVVAVEKMMRETFLAHHAFERPPPIIRAGTAGAGRNPPYMRWRGGELDATGITCPKVSSTQFCANQVPSSRFRPRRAR